MKTILVIEDDEAVRESLKELLELEGFNAIDAETGEQGIQLALKELPDLILCDVNMGDMDGYSVLKRLQSTPVTHTIPFIFLTARGTKADWRQGMELGADDYLTKPCTTEELLAAIASRLAKQSIIQAKTQQQLDNLRSSITLSLPHELRTPITGILTGVELLRAIADSIDTTKAIEIADNIQISTERLHRLIQNFLLYAELEITAHDPERLKFLQDDETCCVQLQIETTATQIATQAERETDLEVSVQEATIALSEPKLQKIMEELIDNAFKFSVEGTPVHVVGRKNDNDFTVKVIDQGRGISAEHLANLGAYMQFERKFYEQQGSGLGLMIAKRLIELHGGSLTIESIPNQQTTVTVTFPLADVQDDLI